MYVCTESQTCIHLPAIETFLNKKPRAKAGPDRSLCRVGIG